MRAWLAYAGALLTGIAAPIAVLWVARNTPVGTDSSLAGATAILVLAIVAALLTLLIPRHWWVVALVVSVPLGLLGTAMFAALANIGEFFWVWLWVALGGVAASLLGAYVARSATRST